MRDSSGVSTLAGEFVFFLKYPEQCHALIFALTIFGE